MIGLKYCHESILFTRFTMACTIIGVTGKILVLLRLICYYSRSKTISFKYPYITLGLARLKIN